MNHISNSKTHASMVILMQLIAGSLCLLSAALTGDNKKEKSYIIAGLEITAGQRTMSGLTVDLTGQTFVLPVMLTGQNSIVLKMK